MEKLRIRCPCCDSIFEQYPERIIILDKTKKKSLSKTQANPEDLSANKDFTAQSVSPKVCPCGHEYSKHKEDGCRVVHREGDDDVYCECNRSGGIDVLFG